MNIGKWLQKLIDKIRGKKKKPVVIPILSVDVPPPELGTPAITPPDAQDLFIYEPGANSITIVIPASVGHWQLNICTTTPAVNHVTGLYGPDKSRGVRTARGYEYVLAGGGETWRSKALAIDPAGGGVIVVFLNTNAEQAHGWKTAQWSIPDPRQPYQTTQQGYVKPRQ